MNARILFVSDLAKILNITESGVHKMHKRATDNPDDHTALLLRKFGGKRGVLESEFVEWARREVPPEEEPSVRRLNGKYVDLLRSSRRQNPTGGGTRG